MGAYTAFLDLALGITSPILSLIASGAGFGAVFLTSTLAVLGAAIIAARLMKPQLSIISPDRSMRICPPNQISLQHLVYLRQQTRPAHCYKD